MERSDQIDRRRTQKSYGRSRTGRFVAPDSPKVSAQQIEALLNQAPWLPQAEQLATMAQKRGAASLPDRPGTRKFSWRGSAARRELPETTSGAANLRAQIQQHIKNDAPSEAERVLEAGAAGLSDAALTELRYRVAWSFYIENDDANARRVAATARAGGGEWGVQSEWVHGLASSAAWGSQRRFPLVRPSCATCRK